jgi:hypothetical protein
MGCRSGANVEGASRDYLLGRVETRVFKNICLNILKKKEEKVVREDCIKKKNKKTQKYQLSIVLVYRISLLEKLCNRWTNSCSRLESGIPHTIFTCLFWFLIWQFTQEFFVEYSISLVIQSKCSLVSHRLKMPSWIKQELPEK